MIALLLLPNSWNEISAVQPIKRPNLFKKTYHKIPNQGLLLQQNLQDAIRAIQ